MMQRVGKIAQVLFGPQCSSRVYDVFVEKKTTAGLETRLLISYP